MDRVAVDTSFLIDLQNERRARGNSRGALGFLRAHLHVELLLPTVALGEYLEGFQDPESPAARALVEPLRLLEVTGEVAAVCARVTRRLRAAGELIGANDLWIGCTALVARVPIVTSNSLHFLRIPDLEVVTYGSGANG